MRMTTQRFLMMIMAIMSLGYASDTWGAASPRSSEEQPTYRGKPLGYWLEQAKAAHRDQSVDTIVQALTRALDHEGHRVMVDAADALASLGAQAAPAAPALASKLDHIQPWVRVAAMDALAAIGVSSVPSLVEAVETGPGGAPVRASIVLGAIGPGAKDAIPALRRRMAESPDNVRWRFADAIAKISGDTEAAVGDTPVGRGKADAGTSARPGDAGDWPQFHGPNRDSLCGETGLMSQWPEEGPELLWKLEGLGRGLSTISIAGGRIYTMGDRTPAGDDRSQFVIAYDLADRHECWATRIGPPHSDGPRCTPTVDGDLLYALGTDGDFVCLESATGKIRWRKHLVTDFGGQMMSGWKFSESPLVDGDRVICTPGAKNAALVALNKETGETMWQTALPDFGSGGNDGAAYSSAVVADIEGVRQYIQMIGRGVVGVDADSGEFLWGYNPIASTTANIPTPVVRDNLVFVTNGYGSGSALIRITRTGDEFEAQEVYRLSAREFQNHHGGVVLVGDFIYGGHGQNLGTPTCLEFASGDIVWQAKAPARGSAAVVYVDGHVIFRYDRGLIAMIEATPEGFRLQGSFQAQIADDGPAWPHPVVHGGKLFLRHNNLLLCYELGAP